MDAYLLMKNLDSGHCHGRVSVLLLATLYRGPAHARCIGSRVLAFPAFFGPS